MLVIVMDMNLDLAALNKQAEDYDIHNMAMLVHKDLDNVVVSVNKVEVGMYVLLQSLNWIQSRMEVEEVWMYVIIRKIKKFLECLRKFELGIM